MACPMYPLTLFSGKFDLRIYALETMSSILFKKVKTRYLSLGWLITLTCRSLNEGSEEIMLK